MKKTSGIYYKYKMEERQFIESDDGFYNKCKAYLNSVDPESYCYFSFLQVIESFMKMDVDLNDYIKGNIFVTNAECYETPEEISEALTGITAAVYMIIKDKGIILTSDGNLKTGIRANLTHAVGNEMSEEIMVFLENYEE
jgi:hypothetical protein